MKSIIFIFFILFLNICISPKEEKGNITGILYEIVIGPNSTKVQMLLSTSTINNTLFTNSNRNYAQEIQQKRNKSTLIDLIVFNQIPISKFHFQLEIDQTDYEDQTIQGEFGIGINMEGKNELIEYLYKDKIIFQKEIIIGAQLILDTYLVTDKYYFANLTDREDLELKYHEAWVIELSHILTGSSKQELIWDNTEEINARAILDSSSKYIYIPDGYMDLFLDIWHLNLTKCPIIEDDKEESVKYIRCTEVSNNYFKKVKPIYFIIDGYALLLTAEEVFENLGDNNFESYIRFRPENQDVWTIGSPFFKKYKFWIKYDKKTVGFNGNDIIDFHKEYKKWREENEFILNKESNDKKIVVIGAVMGSMILLTILFCLCKSIRTENSSNSSKFIEEQKYA